MARKSSTRTGFREVMGMRIRHASMRGAVWSLAPLDVTWFGPLAHHGRKADERECVWVAMSDGYVWYVDLDVRTGEVLTAYTTPQRCPGPVSEPLEEQLPTLELEAAA